MQIFGPPELMIWDGERAIISNEAIQWASRHKLQLIQRSKHKKAWVVERHNEILRHSCHKCQTQLAIEGHDIKFAHVLADAVFSKNALLSIGEGTPYIALLGRVPQLLPQLEHIVGTASMQDETGIDGSRHIHRLREITVSSMVEAKIIARRTDSNGTSMFLLC